LHADLLRVSSIDTKSTQIHLALPSSVMTKYVRLLGNRMMNDLFQRFRHDGDAKSYQQLLGEQRALVYSVCRRYLRDPADVEDAVQETFLKLSRNANRINGSLSAWLSATANSTCVDLIRSAIRERRRRQLAAASVAPQPCSVVNGEIEQKIQEALLSLDDASRQIIIARFYRNEPMRVIAGRYGLTVSGMSRRVRSSMQDLTVVLREMGVKSVDDLAMVKHLSRGANEGRGENANIDGLRFAPDWQNVTAHQSQAMQPAICPLGWSRPLRVGVMVSYLSYMTVGFNGVQHLLEDPVWSTGLIQDRGFQLVAIAEPNSTARGPIERTVREYELTAGLVDSTDRDALATLDVILLGLNYAVTPAQAGALADAVRGGVGLLNEYWLGLNGCVRCTDSANVCALSLAVPPMYAFHLRPRCGQRLPATVTAENPLLPGLKIGARLNVSACGPLYRVVDDARICIAKDLFVDPGEHSIPGLGPARMPVFVVGQLGRGRVVVSNVYHHEQIAGHLNVSASQYLAGLLRWVAEPRREMAA
jgi:RNA polymerase sigma factor (sigma-70 family)